MSEACSMSTPAQCHRRVPLFVRRLDYAVIMKFIFLKIFFKSGDEIKYIEYTLSTKYKFRVKFPLKFRQEKILCEINCVI